MIITVAIISTKLAKVRVREDAEKFIDRAYIVIAFSNALILHINGLILSIYPHFGHTIFAIIINDTAIEIKIPVVNYKKKIA